MFAEGSGQEVERRKSSVHVQGKTPIWESGHCVAELEAARGGMAYCGLTFRPSQAAFAAPSQLAGQALAAPMINENCCMQSHLSSLPGITALFCSDAHHKDTLAADPELRDMCGPSCRHMLASILKAQLRGSMSADQFEAIDSACRR
jgi:hypothetical protein